LIFLIVCQEEYIAFILIENNEKKNWIKVLQHRNSFNMWFERWIGTTHYWFQSFPKRQCCRNWLNYLVNSSDRFCRDDPFLFKKKMKNFLKNIFFEFCVNSFLVKFPTKLFLWLFRFEILLSQRISLRELLNFVVSFYKNSPTCFEQPKKKWDNFLNFDLRKKNHKTNFIWVKFSKEDKRCLITLLICFFDDLFDGLLIWMNKVIKIVFNSLLYEQQSFEKHISKFFISREYFPTKSNESGFSSRN